LAQPFSIGANNTITSFTLSTGRVGNPSGEIRFSLWDSQVSGVPGAEIAEVGSINAANLPALSLPPPTSIWPLGEIQFSTNIGGLTPEENYFLMIDMSDLITVGMFVDTIVLGTNRSTVGTNNAPPALVSFALFQNPPFNDSDWIGVGASFGDPSARYQQMAIEASFVPAPSALSLLLVGTFGFLAHRRRSPPLIAKDSHRLSSVPD
nr:PEP-CTERM sorting domain-containing protein [Gammaproteobacteria bacterium]